jgi:AraC-like DNA-binding protein
MLADPSDARKVGAIALAIGFDSAANFSRAFTQQFGYSPSNVRKQMYGDDAHSIGQTDKGPEVTFEGLLRTLDAF